MAENTILKHQTLTILQQIEELKNWHKQQQSKVNPDIQLQASSNNKPKLEIKQIAESRKSSHNISDPFQNIDEMPIQVANSNFIDLIENNIPNEDKNYENSKKPKFQFLKKGEGIARFRMGPRKIPKNKKINNQTLKLSTKNIKPADSMGGSENITKDTKYSTEEKFNENIEIPKLDPPDLKLDFKNLKGLFNNGQAEQLIEKAIENNQLEMFQPNSSIDSSVASIMEKFITAGRKHLKEKKELNVFETMEQHVLESSFCSTSSYVKNVMKDAIISTPVKNSPKSQPNTQTFQNPNRLLTQYIQQNHEQLLGRLIQQKLPNTNNRNVSTEQPESLKQSNPVTQCPQTEHTQKYNKIIYDEVSTDDFEPSLHVRFAEEVDYKSFAESLNISKQAIQECDKQFDESKEWKEDNDDDDDDDESSCSECRTRYSSSDEDARPISPPGTPPLEKQTCVAGIDIVDRNNVNKQTTNSGIDMFPPVLSAKLKELESEIEIFRSENNKLKAIREKLEKEHKQFQQEKKKILKEIDEEKVKNLAQLDDEKQKLAKEKLIFEKYSKSLTKNPSKEERKEIQALRDQLSEIKEELNKKESRWGAAQARVRNQVKLLEEDNKKLREEVEVLRKKSKSLEVLTRNKKGRAVNNTKLIHAINDHISNMPMGCEETVPVDIGYFKQQINNIKPVEITIDESDPKRYHSVKVTKESSNEHERGLKITEEVNKASCSEKDAPPDNIGSSNVKGQSLKQNNPAHSEINSISGTIPCSNSIKETLNESGSIERVFPDGRKEIRYKNGNIKKIDPFTGNEKTIYFNGDVEEIVKDGTIKYYFSEKRIWHTTLPDGLEVLDFPNGQVEKRHPNGMIEVIYPNNCKKLTYPNGIEEIYYADGTTLKIESEKRKVLLLPNGQKEIHTEECVRRECPDGTVKIVYPDGTTETIYSNGRVRLKDKHGNLVMDSGTPTDH